MRNGFTIIELVISIFILSFAVVGIFSAFSIITILTSDSADRLTATYLAQEGMEIVRNIRDTNWLNMDVYCATQDCSTNNAYSWVDGLDNCASGCEADYTTGSGVIGAFAMSIWPAANKGDYLCRDASTNSFYYYNTANCPASSLTKFKRKIIITQIPDVDGASDHIIKVKVEVAWDQKASVLNGAVLAGDALSDDCAAHKNNCVITEETLYDWYNYVNH